MACKSYFNWSGGKDSALALHYALKNKAYSIERLFTSINSTHNRVSMHGVRETLLEQQAASLGISLQKLLFSEQPSMCEYEKEMLAAVQRLKDENFTHSFFGDIFLDDLRRYREEQLLRAGLQAVFPIWKRNSTELIREFIDLGFKTIIVCVKADLLDESFAGRIIDKEFLKDLPSNVDPCGENGEFHTFVFDGPIFQRPVVFSVGNKVYREYHAPKDSQDNCIAAHDAQHQQMGFWFCDLIEGEKGQ